MNKKSQSIWTASPCSTSHWQGVLPFQKGERFKHGSIYNFSKSQQKVNQKQQVRRPQSVLLEFRRKISQCEKASRKMSRYVESFKNNLLSGHLKKTLQTKPKIKLNKRLYSQKPIIIDKQFDRNGMRSTYYTAKEQQAKTFNFKKNRSVLPNKKKFFGSKLYVSGSLRIDLAKPQNFHPGPGSYFLDRIDKDAQTLYQDNTKNLNYSNDEKDSFLFSQNKQNMKTRPSTTKNIQNSNQNSIAKNLKKQLMRKSKTIFNPNSKFSDFFQ